MMDYADNVGHDLPIFSIRIDKRYDRCEKMLVIRKQIVSYYKTVGVSDRTPL